MAAKDTATEARRVEVTLPSIGEGRHGMWKRLAEVESEFDRFASSIQSVIGNTSTEQWYATLTKPPTVEDIGALWILLEDASLNFDALERQLDRIRDAMGELNQLRLDGDCNGHGEFEEASDASV